MIDPISYNSVCITLSNQSKNVIDRDDVRILKNI